MHILREWLHRLWATLGPGRRDEDLEQELQLHLELVADEARRRGHDPHAAVRLARIDAGGVPQAMEALRDQRGLRWLDDLRRDVRFGLRTLRRGPVFATTAILSLALGIGANTGIFSLVDQVLLRLLPVPEPERLVRLHWQGPSLATFESGVGSLMSYPLCRELQEQQRFFDGVFCRSASQLNFSIGRQYEVVRAEVVSGSYFSVLGLRAELGRLIGASDDQRPGAHPVVVLSHDYWISSLAGAPDIVGKRVLVNTHPMTIIGVAPAGFRGMDLGEPAQLWLPAMMAREAMLDFGRLLDRRAVWMHVFGRLKPGVSAEAAATGLRPWFTAMLEADTRRDDFPPATAEERRAFLAAALEVLPGARGWSGLRGALAQPLWALMAGTILLLLLACLNVASLLLARGAERSQELTTRLALGATRGRITRQLLVESLLIALAGGLLALAVAPMVSRLLLVYLPDGANLTAAVDYRIFLFALAVSIVAGALCGLAPAMQAGRRPLAAAINGRSTAAVAAVRFRKIIVGAQIALTLVLLTGAGLFIQTLAHLQAKDRGFDSARLLMFRLDPAGTGAAPSAAPQVMRDVLRMLREVPGVERAALANNSMLGSLGPGRVLTLDADQRIVLERPAPMMRISPRFFSTLGTRVIAGREFNEQDTANLEQTGPRTLIVNESFAKRYFGDRSAVGRRVGIGNRPDTPVDIEIVGVVEDFSRRSVRDDEQPEHILVPFAQAGPLAGDGVFYVRARGTPESAFTAIRAAVARVDATLPLISLTTLDDQVTRALRFERMMATLTSSFGIVALLLSVVGLFGVMWYVVTQRTQEIGMRLALGATRSAAIWLVIRDALLTISAGAIAGIVIGVTAGVMAAPWLTSVLYGVLPSDAATLAGATLGLAGVALGACVIPAGRAAALSPMAAIRDQPESLWLTAGKLRRAIRDLTSIEPAGGPSITLIGELTGLVQNATSFTAALAVALPALRDRVKARSIVLLERISADEYRGDGCSIPASGVLINRLRHFPHPLPLTSGDIETWRRWAGELRPEHRAEIEQLESTGARMAVALRTRHDVVGVLLLGPPDAGEFTGSDKQLLSGAAEVFALMIENARLNDRALEQEKLRRDVALAAEVQRRLLPPRPPSTEAISLAAFTLPARSVGGDYYDFIDLPDGRLGLAMADIAGKGVAAALLMSVVQASLRVISESDPACAHVAATMNRFLYRSTATNSYATFFYAQLDACRGVLRYVNAGHNPPYLVRGGTGDVKITELTAGGTVLGLFPDAHYESADVELRRGDMLVAFTDGVTEARNANDEEFGEERLRQLLRHSVGAPAERVSALLADQIQRWSAGAEQHDDLTLVVATVN